MMFKNSLREKPLRANGLSARTSGWPRLLLGCLLAVLAAGCHTFPRLPPVNLQEAGWEVREGQASWRPRRDAPELAGDVLLATRPDGRAFVSFSKTPFPLVIAQATTNRWQIELPTQNRVYTGCGQPPARMVWLQLPRWLRGFPPRKHWSCRALPDNGWHITNRSTGEVLDIFFTQ